MGREAVIPQGPDPQAVLSYFRDLQARLCAGLEEEDGWGRFAEDCWRREEGGGGITRVMERGAVLEKAGVNFSEIRGSALPASASAHRPGLVGQDYMASGVSVVIHPRNPYVPTSHMNVRYFQTGGAEPTWWFGGGFDLTPCYGFTEDAIGWHRVAREACRGFDETFYARFKQWCDEYFRLPHRHEQRGIGGLFFDDLSEPSFARCFDFVKQVGDSFLKAYRPIVARRKHMPYGTRERQFQLYRRGRYVEFNLVCDRGTLFGLQSGGRVESILMSLPPVVSWRYDWQPRPGTPEARLYEQFLVPRDWLDTAGSPQGA